MPTTKNRSEYRRRYYLEVLKPRRQRQQAAAHIGGCCYCGRLEKLTEEHITPQTNGGSDSPENLRWACRWCNTSRSSRPIEEWRAAIGRRLMGVPTFTAAQRAWLQGAYGIDAYAVDPEVLALVRFPFEGGDGRWRDALNIVAGSK